MFTWVRHLFPSWASNIQPTPHHISWGFIVMLSSPLCLVLASCLLPSDFSIKTLYKGWTLTASNPWRYYFLSQLNPVHSATQISSSYVLARHSNDVYVSQVSCSRRAFGQQFCMHFFFTLPVAARSQAYFWGRSLAGIARSNPAGCMAVCLLWVLYVVR